MKALVAGICLLGLAGAQSTDTQRFEVASIRVAASQNGYAGPMTGGPGTSDPGRFTWPSASPLSILVKAFGVGAFQVVGSGLEDEAFDITAKVPAGATPDGLNAMLQNMLIDRLDLKFHHESRVMAVYELTMAKNGPKFKESDGSIAASGARYTNGVMRLTLARSPVGGLAGQLGAELERNVIDKTGLKGVYDFQLEYSHEGLRPMPGAPASIPGNAPSLFTAVQEQLGLKLDPAKEPIDVMVIDQISKTPSDN